MCTSSVGGLHLVVLKLHDFGGLWSYKRGGLPPEECGAIGGALQYSSPSFERSPLNPAESGLPKEVVSH